MNVRPSNRVRSRRATGLCALALLAAPGSALGANPHETRLEMDGRWAVVEVRLGSDPAPRRFIVDTAAGATVINTPLAATSLRARTRSDVQGAASDGSAFDSGQLDRLTIAGVAVENLSVVTTDMARFGPQYDGILGHDVLNRFSYVFDVPAGRLTLLEMDRPAPAEWGHCHANLLAGREGSGFLAQALTLRGDVAAEAIIDTGAATTVVNWPAAREAGLGETSAGVTTDRPLGGFDPHATVTSYRTTFSGAALAGRDVAPFAARLSDLPVFAGFGLADRPAAILGINVLKDLPFAVSRGATAFCLRSA